MVEQNVRKALAVADRGYVLERGRIVAARRGPARCSHSDVIRQAYLRHRLTPFHFLQRGDPHDRHLRC